MVETGRIVARDLRTRFGLAQPRLAVAELNPHAGEDGTLGEEDNAIVAPAWRCSPPRVSGSEARCPPTRCFTKRARATYDAALCTYDDQAPIPIKTLAFDHAVNVTLGLAFARIFPDHGTAFDIAGSGPRRPTSLVAALKPRRGSLAESPLRLVVGWREGCANDRKIDRPDATACRRCARSFAVTASSPKSLGQYFPFDLNLTERIARAAGPLDGVTVLEIGPDRAD